MIAGEQAQVAEEGAEKARRRSLGGRRFQELANPRQGIAEDGGRNVPLMEVLAGDVEQVSVFPRGRLALRADPRIVGDVRRVSSMRSSASPLLSVFRAISKDATAA